MVKPKVDGSALCWDEEESESSKCVSERSHTHFWLRDVQRAVSICAWLEGVAQAGGENTGISSLQ